VKRWIAKALLPLTLLLAAAVVVAVVWFRGREDGAPRQPERVGFQAADEPREMPRSGRLDPRFVPLGAWQRAAVPVASGCAAPTASGAWRAVAGEEVLAVADGLVVFAGRREDGAVAAAVLAHRGKDGGEFHSVYPGLDRLVVARGLLVARGSRLGSAGAGGCAVALRGADEVYPGPAPADAVAPPRLLASDGADALAPPILAMAMRPVGDPWSMLQADSPRAAERLLEILGREPQGDD
jgi:hypothetical protein